MIRNQSLAEARIAPGESTASHYHPRIEYFYYILTVTALMRIGAETQEVRQGDAIAIEPGQVHQITNTGEEALHILCCCAPAYEHEDTVLVEE